MVRDQYWLISLDIKQAAADWQSSIWRTCMSAEMHGLQQVADQQGGQAALSLQVCLEAVTELLPAGRIRCLILQGILPRWTSAYTDW